MLSAFQKFGRSMRIYLQTRDGLVQLVNWQSGQTTGLGLSLHCSFVVRRSVNPEPHRCTLSILGLSKRRREQILKAYDEAEEMSWTMRSALKAGRIRVDAGYGDDVATLFVGDIAPDGVTSDWVGPGHVMKIEALDGRIAWKGRFVNKASSKGVDIKTIRQVIAASGDYMAGKDAKFVFEKNFPGLVKKKVGFPGYESGYAIFGESRKHNRQLCAELGIRPFFQDGEVRYMSDDAALLDKAVVLSQEKGGVLLRASPTGLGRYSARTLMEHRLRPGRQVILRDRYGIIIGPGLYRVESMVAAGGNRVRDYNVDVDLTPTKLGGGA